MPMFYDGSEVERVYLNSTEIPNMYLNGDVVFNSNTGPVITLIGDALFIFENDGTYVDEGATAYDKEDGDITSSIVIDGDSDLDINAMVGPATAGVIFDVKDSDNFAAPTVTRTVNVIPLPVTDGLNISWDTQVGDTTVVINGSDMLYTNDGWATWSTVIADVAPQTLAEGVGPYVLRENGGIVTRCHLSQQSGSTKFTGAMVVTGGTNLLSMNSMFRDLDELDVINLTGMIAQNVTDMSNLFNGCDMMATATGGLFDPTVITNITGMFAGCNSLTSLDFRNFDTKDVTDMASLFTNCTNLICITNLDTTNANSKTDMFYLCDVLEQPSPAAQLDLTDTDGARWENVQACPDTL